MRIPASLGLIASLALASHAHAQERGWHSYDLGSGRRATRFLPSAVRPCDPLPIVVFLHGAGGMPESYHSHLDAHAETLGIVLLLPPASGAGWNGADTPTIDAALGAVAADGIRIDERRTYLAGHSAGGAFSYLLAYGAASGFAAVFSMSAPFYRVDGPLSDPMHRAPIHMYYGADDPNFVGGSASMLQAQWTRLGLTHATDVQRGFGHSSWPPSSIRAGLDFLLANSYPRAPTASVCPDPDAGAASPDAGPGPPGDAGTLSEDSGPRPDGAAPRADASPDAGDGGAPAGGMVASGCACRAGERTSISPLALLGLALAILGRRYTHAL